MNENRKVIGKGRVATVYSDGIFAYEVFHEKHPYSWKTYEVDIQNIIHNQTSLPTVSYEIDALKKEIKMDLVQGITLAECIRKEKYKIETKDGTSYLIRLSDIKLYETSNLRMPGDEKIIEFIKGHIHWIGKEKPTFHHSDFHPGNLILTKDQEIGVIDFNR